MLKEGLPSRNSATGQCLQSKASRRAVCQPERIAAWKPESHEDDVCTSETKTGLQNSLFVLLCCAPSRTGLLQDIKRDGSGRGERRWLLLLCAVVD